METDKRSNRPWQTIAMGNIQRVKSVDLSEGDFESDVPFFIRAGVTGSLKYCPWGNNDEEYIIKEFTASAIFEDPEICRKIFADGAGSPVASEIYVGYGV
jgi:hypothetical protein